MDKYRFLCYYVFNQYFISGASNISPKPNQIFCEIPVKNNLTVTCIFISAQTYPIYILQICKYIFFIHNKEVSMGKADTVTKSYMRKNSIFADAFNYLIYNGKKGSFPNSFGSWIRLSWQSCPTLYTAKVFSKLKTATGIY